MPKVCIWWIYASTTFLDAARSVIVHVLWILSMMRWTPLACSLSMILKPQSVITDEPLERLSIRLSEVVFVRSGLRWSEPCSSGAIIMFRVEVERSDSGSGAGSGLTLCRASVPEPLNPPGSAAEREQTLLNHPWSAVNPGQRLLNPTGPPLVKEVLLEESPCLK